ncbi:MAG: hypothetical protein AB2809_10270 [Candidatus Thiodiazotropha sp.]
MTNDFKQQVAAKAIESGGRLTVRSALNPILWMCGIVSVPAMIVAGLKDAPQWWLIAISAAPVTAALFGFFFLLIFDRDKLQSEDYQIKKRSLELMQQKGDISPIELKATPAIPNPESPLLDDTVGGD